MKISAIRATCHNLPVDVPYCREPQWDGIVCVRIETDEGIGGIGFTGGRENRFAMREIVARDLAPLLIGQDPFCVEKIWRDVFRKLGQKTVAGAVAHAMSAIDIALWDIIGKSLEQPIYRLLGGHSRQLEVYATLGNFSYDTDDLVAVARDRIAEGYNTIKIAVGRDEPKRLSIDRANVAAVREAVGPDVTIMGDANQQLLLREAFELARLLEPYDVSWFEEPVKHNDFHDLAELRGRTSIPIAAGQSQTTSWQYRHQVAGGAIDIVQCDVIYVGGFTEGVKVAHLARAFDLPLASHGWPHLNMHLIAAVANGWLLEFHAKATKVCQAVFIDPPMPSDGLLSLGDEPGLGLVVNEAMLAEYAEN